MSVCLAIGGAFSRDWRQNRSPASDNGGPASLERRVTLGAAVLQLRTCRQDRGAVLFPGRLRQLDRRVTHQHSLFAPRLLVAFLRIAGTALPGDLTDHGDAPAELLQLL